MTLIGAPIGKLYAGISMSISSQLCIASRFDQDQETTKVKKKKIYGIDVS